MSEINVNEILVQMLDAAKGVLKDNWEDVKPFANQEFKSLAENLKLIGELRLAGTITDEQAKYYLEIHKSSVRIVLLTVEGIGILAVESAINAALDIVRNTINKALGIVLL